MIVTVILASCAFDVLPTLGLSFQIVLLKFLITTSNVEPLALVLFAGTFRCGKNESPPEYEPGSFHSTVAVLKPPLSVVDTTVPFVLYSPFSSRPTSSISLGYTI